MKKTKAGKVNQWVMPNLIWHLQRLPLSVSCINNVRGRSRIKYGMTPLCNKGGFTLIELLVVVLIIGILAAIALPQYQKAVDRSRATQAVQLIHSLKQAAEIFVLEHPGKQVYPLNEGSSEKLDIDLTCDEYDYGRCKIGNDSLEVDIFDSGNIAVYSYHDYSNDAYVFIGALYENGTWSHKCGYFDDRGKDICEGLQGYEAIENFEY